MLQRLRSDRFRCLRFKVVTLRNASPEATDMFPVTIGPLTLTAGWNLFAMARFGP